MINATITISEDLVNIAIDSNQSELDRVQAIKELYARISTASLKSSGNIDIDSLPVHHACPRCNSTHFNSSGTGDKDRKCKSCRRLWKFDEATKLVDIKKLIN